MMNDQSVRLDRMRFTKNTTSSRLVLLAIVLDALYFVSLYRINLDYYYNMMMGASILYNLVFMLAAFLASEGVKNYRQGFSWVLCALGAGQIVRIFIWPTQAHATSVTVAGQEILAMSNGQFVRAVIYLAASAACLFVAAAVNFTKSRALKAHIAGLEGQKA
jgi:hypothetical protein